MSRRDVARALAPLAPPCFESRSDWLEYVSSAAEAQSEKGQPAVLLFGRGEPVRFNPHLDFCHDCEPLYALGRRAQGRCNPDWLLEQPKPLLQLVREFLAPRPLPIHEPVAHPFFLSTVSDNPP